TRCRRSRETPGAARRARMPARAGPPGSERLRSLPSCRWSPEISPSYTCSLSSGQFASAELAGARESRRRQAARLRAGADPVAHLGDRALTGTRAPAQPVGQGENLGVGQAAVLEPLQDDAAPAIHLRHLFHREQQELAILAERGDRVALDGRTNARLDA